MRSTPLPEVSLIIQSDFSGKKRIPNRRGNKDNRKKQNKDNGHNGRKLCRQLAAEAAQHGSALLDTGADRAVVTYAMMLRLLDNVQGGKQHNDKHQYA